MLLRGVPGLRRPDQHLRVGQEAVRARGERRDLGHRLLRLDARRERPAAHRRRPLGARHPERQGPPLPRGGDESAAGRPSPSCEEVQTDSWDDAAPTGCPGEIPTDPFVDRHARPGDGRGASTGCATGTRSGPASSTAATPSPTSRPASTSWRSCLRRATSCYKEEDKNVDFGDAFDHRSGGPDAAGRGDGSRPLPDQAMVAGGHGAPSPGSPSRRAWDRLTWCPTQLSLFPGVETYAPFAGTERPLCDRKEVILSDQGQAAADFFLFTSTPVAGAVHGPDHRRHRDRRPTPPRRASATSGGRPSCRSRCATSTGRRSTAATPTPSAATTASLPSTFSANIPMPSGYSPNMHLVCLNDPGPIPGPGGTMILDPLRNPNYGIFCYTLQYMPGTTTYLDTPLLPKCGVRGRVQPRGLRVPRRDAGHQAGRRHRRRAARGRRGARSRSTSQGTTTVPNPAYEGPLAHRTLQQPTIDARLRLRRHPGTGSVTLDGSRPLTGISWSNGQITVHGPRRRPAAVDQLVVTRATTARARSTRSP